MAERLQISPEDNLQTVLADGKDGDAIVLSAGKCLGDLSSMFRAKGIPY
ncbi:MAG: hypothetical protein MJK12_03265 [Colwellia sp.]|nr:hypothetical protein [Colwellia sp.]